MDVAEQIIGLERSALDRWIRTDPDNYGKRAPGSDELVMARWNATEVYRNRDRPSARDVT
jgi:hypothetical protein